MLSAKGMLTNNFLTNFAPWGFDAGGPSAPWGFDAGRPSAPWGFDAGRNFSWIPKRPSPVGELTLRRSSPRGGTYAEEA